MTTQTFGDLLYTPPSECLAEFPSPASLKGRIVISTKPPKEYLQTKIKDNGSEREMKGGKDSDSQKATKMKKDNGSEKGEDPSEEKIWGKEIFDLKDTLEGFDKVFLGNLFFCTNFMVLAHFML